MGGITDIGRGLGEAIDTVWVFFLALCDKAPEVIDDLRRLPTAGSHDVQKWALRHHLMSSVILKRAQIIRKDSHWRPGASHRWACGNGRVIHVGNVGGPFDKWCSDRVKASDSERRMFPSLADEMKATELLPNPNNESLTEWLARSKALYLEAASILRVPKVRPRSPAQRYAVLKRHCDWFVDVQVHGMTLSAVARKHHTDRAAVDRATRRVAGLLQLKRRTIRGRPPGTEKMRLSSLG
jgi:hypothetical protein